ncbi:MAG: MarR family transcriptional regulator [Actinomycetota bacterium]|jgi:DNA-binding MarR family transcriptional regulator|nr:MarR family transcriptional regulator [Actinomycetota bacterium]
MAQARGARSPQLAGREAGDDPVSLAQLVFETAASLRRSVVAPVERDHGLPQQSLDVVLIIFRATDRRVRMSDLAAQSVLTPSGLTRAVDRLCEAGLVCRQSCAQDRRGSFAALTSKGAAKVSAALSSHSATLGAMIGEALDPADRAQLATLLARLGRRLGDSEPAKTSP